MRESPLACSVAGVFWRYHPVNWSFSAHTTPAVKLYLTRPGILIFRATYFPRVLLAVEGRCQGVGCLGQSNILGRDPASVVRHQCYLYFAVTDVQVRVVLLLLRLHPQRLHKRHRLHEIRKAEGAR